MKKIQIFVEHDIILRHFILNNTFAHLEKNFQVQYVMLENDIRLKTDVESLGLKDLVRIGADRARVAPLRHLSRIRSIRLARKNPRFAFADETYREVFGPDEYAKMKRLSQPLRFWLHKRQVLKQAGRNPAMEEAVDRFNPDMIIHPTALEGVFIADLCLLAKRRKLPLLVLMNSWDNPSMKAQVVTPPGWLAVWGEQTRRHAVEFMGMPEDRAVILGAAQFEIYRQKPDQSREELARAMGIDPAKRFILYAGSSKSVNEMEHLMRLDKAIDQGEIENAAVIFRPHPWRAPAEGEPDFHDIDWKHVRMDPSMAQAYIPSADKGAGKIHLTRYMDTHNILSASDLLLSNMSTIFVEAALHGLPLLCMLTRKDMKNNNYLDITTRALYFKELMERLDIPRCERPEELPSICRALLDAAQKPSYADSQRKKVKFFVDMDEPPYPERLTNLANDILNAR